MLSTSVLYGKRRTKHEWVGGKFCVFSLARRDEKSRGDRPLLSFFDLSSHSYFSRELLSIPSYNSLIIIIMLFWTGTHFLGSAVTAKISLLCTVLLLLFPSVGTLLYLNFIVYSINSNHSIEEVDFSLSTIIILLFHSGIGYEINPNAMVVLWLKIAVCTISFGIAGAMLFCLAIMADSSNLGCSLWKIAVWYLAASVNVCAWLFLLACCKHNLYQGRELLVMTEFVFSMSLLPLTFPGGISQQHKRQKAVAPAPSQIVLFQKKRV
jgi:hypothetical protein